MDGAAPAGRQWTPAGVVLASLVVTATLVQVAAARDGVGTGEVLRRWDGGWYAEITAHGYPDRLPRDDAGRVVPTTWAFFPLYPLLVRTVMALGLPFPAAAVLVSLVALLGALTVLHRFLERSLGRAPATWALAMVLAFPAAPVLQAAYAESLALLLLVSCLVALRERRHVLLAVLVVLLALTRPITLPLAVVVAAQLVVRARAGRLVPGEGRALVLAVGWCGACFALWPATAAVVTGEPTAYLLANGAWRRDDGGEPRATWLGSLVGAGGEPAVGVVAVLVLVAVAALALTARGWPGQARAWAPAYVAYLLAVRWPSSSDTRYVMVSLLVPSAAVVVAGALTDRRARAALLGGCLMLSWVLQWRWIDVVLVGTSPTAYP